MCVLEYVREFLYVSSRGRHTSGALVTGVQTCALPICMESMTNAPYALPKHRSGARIGHDRVIDTMMMDGLEDAYTPGKAMGAFAEDAAREYQFTREQIGRAHV